MNSKTCFVSFSTLLVYLLSHEIPQWIVMLSISKYWNKKINWKLMVVSLDQCGLSRKSRPMQTWSWVQTDTDLVLARTLNGVKELLSSLRIGTQKREIRWCHEHSNEMNNYLSKYHYFMSFAWHMLEIWTYYLIFYLIEHCSTCLDFEINPLSAISKTSWKPKLIVY